VLQALEAVDPDKARLDPPGVDRDAAVHRQVCLSVFADAGFDSELAEALYAVESDYRHNHFAADATPVLQCLKQRGVRVAVLSDIHFDIRPAFITAGMDGLVDTFILSFEQGVQKPDPSIFAAGRGQSFARRPRRRCACAAARRGSSRRCRLIRESPRRIGPSAPRRPPWPCAKRTGAGLNPRRSRRQP
jgi:hypothetical protein